ncbi:tetratricopeptide repeat protein [Balneolaceae bacterium YR4-1]|uniref:Tetratricopeptide repeat protein n=1 Tax=Halalkalibaculum roseum TaxID=2709311 RepID=A0A6M1SWN9_9BACT|nr:tetratricopeptide repeat protein [Halalkalibaculum roseum]
MKDIFNKLRFVLLFLLLLSSTGTVAKAQGSLPELINDQEFKPVAQAAVDSVYNFNFIAADELLKPWKEEYPEHPLWMLIDAMQMWWQVLSDLEDTSHDEEFFFRMKRTDYEAARLLRKNSKHADGLIIKAISNGYVARQYANRDEWLSSISSARKALSAHEYLLELQPELVDLKLAEGLKLYYLAYLPEAYPVVKTVSWAMPEGNKEKGLDYLKEASENAVFARAEATYFLGNINYNYQDDYDEAANYFEELYRNYPHNNYYARMYVGSLYKMGRYEDALQVIDNTLKRWKENDLPHGEVLSEELLTWKGRILNRNGQTSEAIEAFDKAFQAGESLPNTSHRSFYVAAGYYLGKLYHDRSSYTEAKKYLSLVQECETGAEYKQRARELLQSM